MVAVLGVLCGIHRCFCLNPFLSALSVPAEGNEATDTRLPYDPRVTGHRSQLELVLNVALSSPRWAIECFIGQFTVIEVVWARHQDILHLSRSCASGGTYILGATPNPPQPLQDPSTHTNGEQ